MENAQNAQNPLWNDEERHVSAEQLQDALAEIQASPTDSGTLELIVRRPATDQREVVSKATLDSEKGLLGDNWLQRANPSKPSHRSHQDMQINIMNSRAVAAIAGDRSRWALAGDQLYVDLDLSEESLPPGARLAIGSVILEITAEPHLGCKKFSDRFGKAAVLFVNSDIGKALHLRGLNAKIIKGGEISTGDTVRKL